MIYGVTYGDKHSFRDWSLWPTSAPVVSPPEVQTRTVDIPGLDGALDLTTSIDGKVHYKSRKFSHSYKCILPRSMWAAAYSRILNDIHGKSIRIEPDDDRMYYYTGRATVNAPDYDKKVWRVKIEAEVEPYKLEKTSSDAYWEWDPFEFECGVARQYYSLPVHDSRTTYTVITGRMEVSPFVTVRAPGAINCTLEVYATSPSMLRTYTLTGTYSASVTVESLPEAEYEFTFYGCEGTANILFRGGSL